MFSIVGHSDTAHCAAMEDAVINVPVAYLLQRSTWYKQPKPVIFDLFPFKTPIFIRRDPRT